ncbi:MAG: DUF2752 domain-containing protein [Lachnospiraceae bacterium]|nr:DUF2752 domain-containing protein [Lachnospiraceae bacterium]
MKERIKADIRNFYPAVIVFAIYNLVARSIFHAYCPFLITTGFPCPGCGMTRAAFYLLTGRFNRGMSLNPAAPLWIAFIVCFFIERYLRGRTPKYMKILLAVVVLITVGIYLYRMAHFFPGSPPLVFYRNNLISRTLRIIRR